MKISDVYACICSLINNYSNAAKMTSRWYYLYNKRKVLVSTVSGYGLFNGINNTVNENNIPANMRASKGQIIKAEHVNNAIK